MLRPTLWFVEDRLETLDARPAVCAEPSNSPDGVRWNTAFAYLDDQRHSPSLTIIPNAHANSHPDSDSNAYA